MANKNQHRGGQHSQDQSFQGSRNQMGQYSEGGQGSRDQQSAFQDNQGQLGGNYGHDTNYRGPQEYGNRGTQGGSQRDTYGNYGLSRDAGYNPRETNANDNWEPENSRGPRGYGHSQAYGGPLGYQDDSHRGDQSWQQFNDRFSRSGAQGGNTQGGFESHSGTGGQHHDPDYHQWRSDQIRGLDSDYKAWRDERYSKFSSEFGEWRKGRKDTQSSSGLSDSESSSPTGSAGQGNLGASPKSK